MASIDGARVAMPVPECGRADGARYSPVLVWRGQGEGDGNAALVDHGGRAIQSAEEAVDAALGRPSSEESGQQLSLLHADSNGVGAPATVLVAAETAPAPGAEDIEEELDRFQHERLEPMGLSAATAKTYRRGAKLLLEWRQAQMEPPAAS